MIERDLDIAITVHCREGAKFSLKNSGNYLQTLWCLLLIFLWVTRWAVQTSEFSLLEISQRLLEWYWLIPFIPISGTVSHQPFGTCNRSRGEKLGNSNGSAIWNSKTQGSMRF